MKYSTIEVARELETPVPPIYVPDLTTTVGKLKHLRHVVERIPPELFNISLLQVKTDCGTIGCIAGHAALDDHFRQSGMAFDKQGFSFKGRYGCGFGTPLGEAFGITWGDAFEMCTGSRHPGEPLGQAFTISHGLARIDRMITKYSAGES